MKTELYTAVPFELAVELIGYGPSLCIKDDSVIPRGDFKIERHPLLVAELEQGTILVCFGGGAEFHPNIDLPDRNFILPDEYDSFNIGGLLRSLIHEKIEKIVFHGGYLDGWDNERFLIWEKLSPEQLEKLCFDKDDFIRLRLGSMIKRRRQIIEEYQKVIYLSDLFQRQKNKQAFDLFQSNLSIQAISEFFESSEKSYSKSTTKPTLDEQEGNPE
ncbi:hypothetical protein KC842_01550 [Candidatus Nomurabacteria bacterium]|nr:hypothetical protein [Candidatus Nomurabacteria bacterium]USN94519.1 MAG: hypothetical protein H6791_02025 [Candidatus Nomurabacteria bacterium]